MDYLAEVWGWRRDGSNPCRQSGTTPEPQWPPECLAAERKFRVPSAKLYPLLDHVVLTPEGAGVLLRVFAGHVTVHFKGDSRTREFRPQQIAIAADTQAQL